MADGLHAANLANKWLAVLNNSGFTAITTCYAKLHTGDPGSAGTANASGETDRKAIDWTTPSGGAMGIEGTLPSWTGWDQGSETLQFISVWDHETAGNFLFSVALTANKSIANGDDLTLTALSLGLTPLAA